MAIAFPPDASKDDIFVCLATYGDSRAIMRLDQGNFSMTVEGYKNVSPIRKWLSKSCRSVPSAIKRFKGSQISVSLNLVLQWKMCRDF